MHLSGRLVGTVKIGRLHAVWAWELTASLRHTQPIWTHRLNNTYESCLGLISLQR